MYVTERHDTVLLLEHTYQLLIKTELRSGERKNGLGGSLEKNKKY